LIFPIVPVFVPGGNIANRRNKQLSVADEKHNRQKFTLHQINFPYALCIWVFSGIMCALNFSY
jgi:hypothetical protein